MALDRTARPILGRTLASDIELVNGRLVGFLEGHHVVRETLPRVVRDVHVGRDIEALLRGVHRLTLGDDARAATHLEQATEVERRHREGVEPSELLGTMHRGTVHQ